MTVPSSFWRSVESLHHVVYLVPQVRTHYASIGLKGMWMGYFASRSAALGTPSPELVVATFHGFAPRMVHRALPDAWRLATRDDVLAARLALSREVLGAALGDEQVVASGAALREVAAGLDLAGKPLAAAHAALTAPGDALGDLWHAGAIVREYRGDCHVAVLVASGLDGVEANVLNVAAGRTFPDQQSLRGWDDDEWSGAGARLRGRGWLAADGSITEAGSAARTALEDATDRACLAGMDAAAAVRAAAASDDLAAAARAVRTRWGTA